MLYAIRLVLDPRHNYIEHSSHLIIAAFFLMLMGKSA